MKKFWKYSSLFFALYHLFLVIMAIFDPFQFTNGGLRLLLALTAFQVAIYKFFEYLEDKWPSLENKPDPTLNKTINIETTPAPIVRVREVFVEHKEVYQKFSESIKNSLARNLGERMLDDNLITFTVQARTPDTPEILTITADAKVVGGTNNEKSK